MKGQEDPRKVMIHRHLSTLQDACGCSPHVVCVGQPTGNDRFMNDIGDSYSVMRIDLDSTYGDSDARNVEECHTRFVHSNVPMDSVIVFMTAQSIPNLRNERRLTVPFMRAGAVVTDCYVRGVFTQISRPWKGVLGYEGMFTLAAAWAESFQLDGDYLEFGVYDGRTISLAFHAMGMNLNRRFFAFDSFAGIIGSMDGEDAFMEGSYFCSERTFRHNMALAGVDPGRVIPVKGDFLKLFQSPSLRSDLGITACAVAHLDCDVYAAAKASLDFLTPVLRQGSLLLFDEFHANGANRRLGERRALEEWLSENTSIAVERWHDYSIGARSYIVHTDATPQQ